MALDLSRLSAGQREVALAPDGPLLVVAGPGSGKTTALVARVGVLVAGRGVKPESVLALTFTAAAAREMRARLVRLLGTAGRADVCTFHAFGLRLVRRWSVALGYGTRAPVVYGPDDALHLLRAAAARLGYTPGDGPFEQVASCVERIRLDTPPSGYGAAPTGEALLSASHAQAPCDARCRELATAYEALLLRRGAVDFPAMLALPLRLFAERPDALRRCQAAHRYLLCDEYQDLCPSQYALLRHLGERHRNVTAVGDPRQTIFGWRGADVRLMGRFSLDFPGARIVALSQNFRSTGRIVQFANALGAPLGDEPSVWTENEPGHAVGLHAAVDERAEASFVAGEIARLERTGQIDRLDDVAVLYRTNGQAHALTLALRARGVAYHVVGVGDMFARREVRAAVAYARLAHNPNDGVALARVIDLPPRGLASLGRHLRRFPTGAEDLVALAERVAPDVSAQAEAFGAALRRMHVAVQGATAVAALDEVLEESGYRAWIEQTPGAETRLKHLAALRALAAASECDLGGWLAELHLGEAPEPSEPEPAARVVLTSIHAAKGKEWPVVFLTGLEDGLLPHARAQLAERQAPAAAEALAEELRVAYVAVTRPRHRLYLTYSRIRRHGPVSKPRTPSRFLNLIPAGLLRPSA